MATIRQVAARAGVSVATVSAVITGKRRVSEELRNKVQIAMEELNYHPNALARALYANRTYTIAYMVPSIANQGFSNALKAVETVANENGYAVFVCNTNGSPEMAAKHQKRLLEMRIDGVLLALTWELTQPEFVAEFQRHGVKVVGLSGGRPVDGISCFLGDDEQAGYDLGRYLTSLGHRRCAFIGPAESAVGNLRLAGLQRAFTSVDGAVPSELVIPMDGYDAAAGKKALYSLLSTGEGFTCIVCFNDAVAAWVLVALTEQGIAVPQRLSVATFGNVYAPITQPPLTTMVYSELDAGIKATECLLAQIAGADDPPKTHLLRLELEVRTSTRAIVGET
ncbi:MAG: LacI family DNA-binding transcriptional regulator [Limnochordia bacterium]